MDPANGSMFGNSKGRPKRKWSQDFPDGPLTSLEYGPMAAGRHHTATSFSDDMNNKRPRLSDMDTDNGISEAPRKIVLRRRLTLVDLPPEIQQHIFTFVDPVSLGRLIRVNRRFRALLDPAVSLPPASDHKMQLAMQTQDLIWAISRRTFLQGFPKPMDKMTELEMWRLVRGRSCQFCGESSQKAEPFPASDPWSAGPGPEGVRTIWPFRIRSCASCLQPRLVKESEMLVSSLSVLRPGLPFAIFTQSLNYVPSAIIQQREPPPRLELVKYYFRPQLLELQSVFNEVQALGSAAASEWYKGQEGSGYQRNADAARFEQWELQGGLSRMSILALQYGPNVASSQGTLSSQGALLHPSSTPEQPRQSSAMDTSSPGQLSPGPPLGSVNSHESQLPAAESAYMTMQAFPSAPGSIGIPGSTLRQDQAGSTSMRVPLRQKAERSLKEVEQTKAERRKDIEKRCQALKPPIMPSTLPFMDAFKAAILISLPLDDRSWEILKPRLLAQRTEAEQREKIHEASTNPAMQLAERQQLEEEQRVAQENITHMLLGLKVSGREKLHKYAQDFIHQTWSDGRAVTKSTASKFAAEVLCHVRQRFDEAIAQEDRMLALKGTAFPQDPDSMASRRLNLEDMKWAFEELVKPHIDRFGRDLFLCSMCDTSQKLFSFEAVIQHFAAKHTNQFSRGNSMVYWKADWPIDPPFDPAPNIPWALNRGHNISQMHAHPRSSSRGWVSPMASGFMPANSHQTQANEVAALAREFWDGTEGIWDLSNPVRLYIIIQHINLGFLRKFSDETALSLFAEVVSSRPDLQPLRSLTGLRCKMCSEIPSMMRHHGQGGNWYSLPELLTHFQHAHLDSDASSVNTGIPSTSARLGVDPMRLDWKRDMTWLPSEAAIKALVHSSGMDQKKLQIIAEAFPEQFPPPLPRAGPSSAVAGQIHPQTTFAQDLHYTERFRPGTGHGSIRGSVAGSYTARSEGSGKALEDAYDPHRPAAAMPRRSGQDSIYSPPREEIRYRSVPYYPARSPTRQESYYSEIEDRPVWESQITRGPYSHDSMIYSYEDGSSRFSYRETLPRESETTVGGISEPRPGSKGTSRHSVPQVVVPESRVPTMDMEVQQTGVEEAASNAAVNFLNTFNPLAGEEEMQAEAGSKVSPARQAEQYPVNTAGPRSVIENLPQNVVLARSGDHILDSHFPPYTPALPIRESGRLTHRTGEHARQGHRTTMCPGDDGLDSTQGMVASHRYVEELPERFHRVQYAMQDEDGRDQVLPYTDAPYETRYYYEDPYDRVERGYEALGSSATERHPRQIEEPPDRFIAMPGPGPRHVGDRRYHLNRDDGREEYFRSAPRDYQAVGDNYHAGRPGGSRREYSDYSDRYPREEAVGSRPRLRTVAVDNREVIYEPHEPPRRYAPRPMPTGRNGPR